MRRDLLRQPDPERAIGFAEWQVTEQRQKLLPHSACSKRAQSEQVVSRIARTSAIKCGLSLVEAVQLAHRSKPLFSSLSSVLCRRRTCPRPTTAITCFRMQLCVASERLLAIVDRGRVLFRGELADHLGKPVAL